MADEQALEDVFGGPEGLLTADLSGRVIAETSTVMPDFIRTLARRVADQGGMLVDAPILGTVGPAREGKITVVAGGPDAAVERVKPVFGHLSNAFFPMGASGNGATMKLVVIMHLCTYWQSLAEALKMGRCNGLSDITMLEVLLDSPVATSALKVKMPLIRGETSEVGYDIGGVCDVLRRALELADLQRVAAPASQNAMKSFADIRDSGRQRRDVIQLVLDAIGRG
ncbi:MAG: NAD(P)-dependent oxidoreductase, partial [Thermomicrobiales bacterium]